MLYRLDSRNSDKSGRTSLLYCIHRGRVYGIRSLVNGGVNVKIQTDEGFTALHLVYARYCGWRFIKLRKTMSYLEAQLEQKKAGEVLSNTISALKEFGIDEEAIDYVTVFNTKRYFSWLRETMTEEGPLGIF